MKVWKKTAMFGLGLVAAVTLAACGSGGASTDSAAEEAGYVPEKLTVQFVPSQAAETLEAKAKPLEQLLSDELGIPVTVSVSTDYNTIVEAMASKQVDVGFLPPNAYVLANEQSNVKVLLQAQRYGIKQPGGESTDELVDSYRSMIVVKSGSDIKELEDLKGKTIATQDVTSSAGYVWPVAEMKKAGIDINTDVTTVQVKGHDQAVLSVLNGDVDAAFVFEDARNTVKNDYPEIMDEVEPMYFTEPIPNDTISVRSDMSEEWDKKIQDAFIAIGKDEEGKQIISDIYSHEGYVVSKDSNFDIVREYAEQVGQ
ncbi:MULTISPECIES: phosphate/phosphite/phosphonate ABC transporter substrate-binding protein [unclassified Enterococcus]|jgi:phosphonate transport system substrate-binding protein|uniref:phosphate/phosphite/phosphonate ABC transporter substrate-binding protein n=1 Tax=unclassified Enterococcus TaxID=2608891 RepID=UPI0009C0AD54|nr:MULTISPECIES: phosphate/phosphite/phosphonate ABC transporter substrate-binding protein [unclassified Enterococcus]EAC3855333.1 phosphate/phosphite/phosphonate ABC transporter substrate-binding protein [Listeria monocytogenes]OQO87754.1 phosphonate-binding protein [Enterococcus casseliflavus]EAC9663491.1 phosphate/phosphite/phosphonate ABC transporter substrate-binding protein [Listeria monocytogenes]EAG2878214.1 phosphate/phosphite/phosphonate ABC transporter substrate-binding protein [List